MDENPDIVTRIQDATNDYYKVHRRYPLRITVSRDVARKMDVAIRARNENVDGPLAQDLKRLVHGDPIYMRGILVVADLKAKDILDIRDSEVEPVDDKIDRANTSLTERRAQFVYDAARLAAAAANAPIVPVPWSEREAPFRKQFFCVIERQCGEQRSKSPEELHGSWMQAYFQMGWTYGLDHSRERKTHPDLVPYADLGQLERDKDAVFIVLCEIARQWITET